MDFIKNSLRNKPKAVGINYQNANEYCTLDNGLSLCIRYDKEFFFGERKENNSWIAYIMNQHDEVLHYSREINTFFENEDADRTPVGVVRKRAIAWSNKLFSNV